MAEWNGGQVLARCLANEGVRFVFGLPSPEIDPLLPALEEHGMRLVPVRHEAAGAHMAEGLYAEGLDELEAALQRARAVERPAVVYVRSR